MILDKEKPDTAIVLGGTLPHCDLVINLKKRGYYVILIDYNKNPPAKKFANKHYQESTLEVEVVYKIALLENAVLVISTCIDQANLIACIVGERLNLPIPYSSKVAKVVTDKIAMKKLMLQKGISTSDYREFSALNEIEGLKLNYPLIVKPVDSNSSKGVNRVSNFNELTFYARIALELSRCGRAIVEEFVEGTEIGIDCVVKEGVAEILMVKERQKIPGIEAQQIYGCVWPIELDALQNIKYKKIAELISDALGLFSSTLMIQAIENTNGISVIEFAARIGGGESFRLIKRSVDVDIVDLAIDTFLGQTLNFKVNEPSEYYSETFIYANACNFNKLDGFNCLLEDGVIEYIDSNKEQGSEIGGDLTSNNRVGVFAVKGSNRHDLNVRRKKALDKIQVIDCDGINQIKKEIYMKLITMVG